MSTARTRSTLLALGAPIFSCALAVSACTSTPVATATLPPTSPVTSSNASSPSLVPTSSSEATSSLPAPSPSSASISTSAQSAEVDPGPIIATVPTDAPSSPAVPQATTLDVPAGARQQTIGGAGDFVEWWFNLGTAALQARDNSLLEEYSGADCDECKDLLQRNAASISVGRSTRLEGDAWVDLIQGDMTSEDVASFVLIGYVPTIQYLSEDGAVTDSIEPSAFLVGVDAEWDGEHWRLARFREVK